VTTQWALSPVIEHHRSTMMKKNIKVKTNVKAGARGSFQPLYDY
jgi:hypothetical protein